MGTNGTTLRQRLAACPDINGIAQLAARLAANTRRDPFQAEHRYLTCLAAALRAHRRDPMTAGRMAMRAYRIARGARGDLTSRRPAQSLAQVLPAYATPAYATP